MKAKKPRHLGGGIYVIGRKVLDGTLEQQRMVDAWFAERAALRKREKQREKEWPEYKKMPLRKLGLGTRAKRLIGHLTIEEFSSMSDEQILAIEGMGRTTLAECRETVRYLTPKSERK